ncbi:MAG: NUDIX domain-containing protein [bacterium]|nr:NUDIX domain-containing protein [bacterium]
MNREQRHVSILAPLKRKDGKTYIFLQKRSENAKRAPGYFGFFGGGIKDGETPEQALEREIQEELTFKSTKHSFFKKYDLERCVAYVYLIKVEDDFENTIQVKEGDYGKFFTEEELAQEKNVIPHDRQILKDIFTRQML